MLVPTQSTFSHHAILDKVTYLGQPLAFNDVPHAELATVEVQKTKLKKFIDKRSYHPSIGFAEILVPHWKSIKLIVFSQNGDVWEFYSSDINGNWDVGTHSAKVVYDEQGIPVLVSCDIGATYPYSLPKQVTD